VSRPLPKPLADRPTRPEPPPGPRPLTVSELCRRISVKLKEGIGRVVVEGEVSNFRLSTQGHAYFDLKDEGALINAVCFRGAFERLSGSIELADGKLVEVRGEVTIYTPRSVYQLIVESIREAGLGELMRRFLQLREKLAAEGLFAAARKRPIPALPRRIGIVTSLAGAALPDMLHVLGRRARGLEVYVSACAVQGDAAPPEIVQALARLARHGRAEVIIVGRGGGSIEDLWAFNDERVVRAIAACPIPVVSAVGHETDTTLSDFAADLRAPTPSAAAEIVTRGYEEFLQSLGRARKALHRTIRQAIDQRRQRVRALGRDWRLNQPRERLYQARQRVDELRDDLDRVLKAGLERRKVALRGAVDRLGWLSPTRRVGTAAEASRRLQASLNRAVAAHLQHRRGAFASLLQRLTAAHPRTRWATRLADARRINGQMLVRLRQAARRRLEAPRLRLQHLAGRLAQAGHPARRWSPQLTAARTHCRALEARLDGAAERALRWGWERLAALAARVRAAGPDQVLARGFSIISTLGRERLVTGPGQARPGQTLRVRSARGEWRVAALPNEPEFFDET